MSTNPINVTGLHQNSVYEDIQTFLNKHGMNSKETEKKYNRSIRNFFMYFRNKTIENLTVDDLKLRNADMLRYQIFLQQKYENITVNSMLAAIISLYDFLESNEYPVKHKTMKVDNLPEDSESYGKLSIDEAEEMARLATKQVKGIEKSALIKLAFKTSIRQDALLSLTWDDIKEDAENDLYVISVIDKGNKRDKKPISKLMFEELLAIKSEAYYERYLDQKIFHLSKTTLCAMMKTLREEMNIPDSRNIVFHSFKNIGIRWELENGTLERAKRQGNHSNIQTTIKHYGETNAEMQTMFGIVSEKQVDASIFDELDREELIYLLKSIGNGIGIQLRSAAKRLIEERK